MKAPLLTSEQWAQIEAHTLTMRRPQFYSALLKLVRVLGMRPIEIAELDVSWIRSMTIRIPQGYSKRGRARTLPINEEIHEALRGVIGNRSGKVFLNREGQPFDGKQMSLCVKRLFTEAGVEGSTYSGRRGAAQRLLKNKENVLVIQAFLGHSSPVTTLKYVTADEDMVRSALFG